MDDDVLINKAATVERCVARAREEYAKNPDTFATDFTRQDAAILNLQRACQASLDMGQHVVRMRKLGIPQRYQDVFTFLEQAQLIDQPLSDSMKRMCGFRNIAVHEYQKVQLPITVAIIKHDLDDFTTFTRTLPPLPPH
ncbi:type VII toxin-antitoxin system HepT family RNase toxin [Pseudomonas sp. KNUC1026]|uniref:type VII toxin-antitoxin system HepT family RNase toxin n=1 Tax=Pseudomonas sp. KNUC1026 TaxID=2893890 RepID=UPI001F1A0592|nr:DUF86 domain-containing protein [Pseudomonas sp. KNUC1026]UFH51464.1 DUF86 domain-containing protein [Pseudomonas sp. KNUC1026]